MNISDQDLPCKDGKIPVRENKIKKASMPTPASARYPKPTSWDEFEDISLSSFKTRWKNPNLERHGRQGQAQKGVDIYGSDSDGKLVGIQCKNTVKTISEGLVDGEVLEAEKFIPSLTCLYIATTADTDEQLQSYVRLLSVNRQAAGKFTVVIVFWDAIEHDLSGDPIEVQKHYPHYSPQLLVSTATTPHQRDVKTLTKLLNVIDLEATNDYLGYMPKYLSIKFLEHTPIFSAVVTSPTFHIYDQELKEHVENWLNKWSRLAELIRKNDKYNLRENANMLIWHMPGDFIRDPEEQKLWDDIIQTHQEFFELQGHFVKFVRTKFSEVDISATSEVARNLY